MDDGLVGGLDGEGGFFGEGLAGDGDAVAVEEAGVEEALGEEAAAACVLVVLGDVLAAGGEVADEGRVLGDAVEVVHGEGDVDLAGDGDEVEDGVGAAAGGADGGDGVLDGLAGEDFAGAYVVRAEVHDDAAGFAGGFVLCRRTWRGRR